MHDPSESSSTPVLAARSAFGGVLMGLANLVPGISGGTMLVAAGVYPAFIGAISDVSRLRFRFRPVLTLVCVAFAAAAAIVLLAGPVKDLVVDHRWIMYAMFIGLTLGGAPVVAAMATRKGVPFWLGALAGFAGMVALALAQRAGASGGGADASFIMFVIAGIAGASAMILPGVSGGYLLLILGQYVAILAGIDAGKEALREGDISAFMGPALQVFLPVGIGVVVGIVAVSNLLKALLAKAERATLGVLLGLLIGAVVGLYPFQQGVPPEIGSTFKGQTVTATSLEEIEPEDYPLDLFTPTTGQIAASVAIVGIGFATTLLIARVGAGRRHERAGNEGTDMTEPLRREDLWFETLDDMLNDADNLLASGYQKAGNWSLGQICWHLAGPIDQSIDGWTVKVPGIMRFAATTFMRKRFLTKPWPAGIKIPKGFRPTFMPPEVPDEEGVALLHKAVARLRSTDTRHPSPLIGPMTVEQYNRFHCSHGGLHLSHLVPNQSSK